MQLGFPVKGKHVGFPSSQQPPHTSRDLNNVLPYFDGKMCGGQRFGADKKFAQQVGGGAYQIVAMCSVTTVD